jgi:hypothetical protein
MSHPAAATPSGALHGRVLGVDVRTAATGAAREAVARGKKDPRRALAELSRLCDAEMAKLREARRR